MRDENIEKRATSKEKISEHVKAHVKAVQETILEYIDLIQEMAARISLHLKKGGKILIAGNGGSAADAMHFATELVGKFKRVRKGIPALTLNSDQTLMTCISNDFGYEEIFERQIETLGNADDILIVLTTSGRSRNIIKAIEKASSMGITIIAVTGEYLELIRKAMGSGEGRIISVKSNDTAVIQEVTYTLLHILASILDEERE